MRMHYLSVGATCTLLVTSAAMAQPGLGGVATSSTTVPTTSAQTSRPGVAAGPTIKGSATLPSSQAIVGSTQRVTGTDARATGMNGPTGLHANNGGRAGVREGDDDVSTDRGVSYADGSSATVSPNGSVREDLTPQSTDPGQAPAPTYGDQAFHAWSAASTALGGDSKPNVEDGLVYGHDTGGTHRAVAGVRGTPDERPTFGTDTLKGPQTGGAGGDPRETGTNGSHGVSAANGAAVNLGNRAGGDAAPAAPKPPEAFNTGKLNNGASDPTPR